MKLNLKDMEIETEYQVFNLWFRKCPVCKGIIFPLQHTGTNEAFFNLKPCHVDCYLTYACGRRMAEAMKP